MKATGNSQNLRLLAIGVCLLAFIGVLVAIPALNKASEPKQQQVVLSSPEEYLKRINKERAKIEAPALTIDPVLNQTAKAKADDMVAKHYFEHDSPDGTPWSTLIRSIRHSNSALGENLEKCSVNVEQAMGDWIKSPEHYKNIMDNRWKVFGSYSEIDPKDGCMIVVNHFASE